MTVVVAVALTGTFVGLIAGTATAITGAVLAFHYLIGPALADKPESVLPLIGFSIIAMVLLATSQLYRSQVERNVRATLAAAEKDAETADLFARELAHRLKNALAVVQSIANQTLPKDAHQQAFIARLGTMARAHDLLTEHVAQPTAKACEVIDHALEPFHHHASALAVSCDRDIELSGQDAVSVSLALHELATNATKYGAWHDQSGRVSIIFERTDSGTRFEWKEHDGPAVGELTERGFGTKLLRRLGRTPSVVGEADGLRYRTTF